MNQLASINPAILGAVVLALALLGQLGMSWLTLFITRREVETRATETERRLQVLEARNSPTNDDHLSHARRNADAHTELDRKIAAAQTEIRSEMNREIGKLYEKINQVDKGVTAVEVETHLQSKTLTAIAQKLNVIPS